MKQLYFCRHGESMANAQRIYAGQLDTPLSDHGREQAQLAGSAAPALNLDLIISSPLSRAHDTADIIAKSIGYPSENIVINDIYKERFLGSLQGKSWVDHPEDEAVFTDIESHESLLARALAGLAFARKQDANNVLIVGHGSYATALREAIDASAVTEELPNAQIVQLI